MPVFGFSVFSANKTFTIQVFQCHCFLFQLRVCFNANFNFDAKISSHCSGSIISSQTICNSNIQPPTSDLKQTQLKNLDQTQLNNLDQLLLVTFPLIIQQW